MVAKRRREDDEDEDDGDDAGAGGRFNEDDDDGDDAPPRRGADGGDGKSDGGGATGKKKKGGFHSLALSQPTIRSLVRMGFRQPTPIQRKAIPPALRGRDVVAMARTGSGKTIAFLVPMVERLTAASAAPGATTPGIRAVVLSPTRELTQQTYRVARDLARGTGLRVSLLQGGDSMEAQFDAISANPDIVVATPGRLAHLLVEMGSTDLNLSLVEMLVMDEADRLFEMGFAEQLKSIMAKTPPSRQTLLYSATLPAQLAEFSRAKLREPEFVRLDTDTRISDTLKLAFFKCRSEERLAALVCVFAHLIDSTKESTIVFCATQYEAEFVAGLLEAQGVVGAPTTAALAAAAAMEASEVAAAEAAAREAEGNPDEDVDADARKRGGRGSRFQQRRNPKDRFGGKRKRPARNGDEGDNDDDDDDDAEAAAAEEEGNGATSHSTRVSVAHGSMDHFARRMSLSRFRSGRARVLVVTDLAARGLDIPLVNNVVNFSFPDKPKLFVHRVGRAGRQGRPGTAYSLVGPDETGHLVDLLLFLGRPLRTSAETPEDDSDQTHVGSLPQSLLDVNTFSVNHTIDADATLEKMLRSVRNGHKAYLKTRTDASARSVRRAKDLPEVLPVHRLFAPLVAADVDATESLRDAVSVTGQVVERIDHAALAAFRPKRTTFETELGRAANVAAHMMRVMQDARSRMAKIKTLSSSSSLRKRKGEDDGDDDDDDEDDDVGFDVDGDDVGDGDGEGAHEVDAEDKKEDDEEMRAPSSTNAATEHRVRLSAAARRRAKKAGIPLNVAAAAAAAAAAEDGGRDTGSKLGGAAPAPGAPSGAYRDAAHFISTEASVDRDYETHLGINNSLQDAVLDVVADEAEGMAQQRRMVKWDQRKRKYVQATLKEHVAAKRMKSESGTAINVANRGQLYKKWQEKNRRRAAATSTAGADGEGEDGMDGGGGDVEDAAAATDVKARSRIRKAAAGAAKTNASGPRPTSAVPSDEELAKKMGEKSKRRGKFGGGKKGKRPAKAGSDARVLRVGRQKPGGRVIPHGGGRGRR